MLKLIAALLMLIDHFAIVFISPSSSLFLALRLIGRLAMPIFAYKIAIGFKYTRHFNQYLLRIAMMTLLAQIPFTVLLHIDDLNTALRQSGFFLFTQHWNIGLTFLCSLLMLKCLTSQNQNPLITFLSLLILYIIASFGDYGLYGVLMVFIFYFTLSKPHMVRYCACLILLLHTVCAFTLWQGFGQSMFLMQLPVLFALPLIRYVPDGSTWGGRYFFYLFYPLHMLLLFSLKILL